MHRRLPPVYRIAVPACAALLAAAGCATRLRYTRGGEPGRARPARHTRQRAGTTMSGTASYYGPGFHGRTTANGERFDMYGLTAAHKTLPFDTRLRVTNLDNGRSVVVRINDRGPYKKGRILDLSLGAARKIGMVKSGTARVRLEVVQ